MHPKAKLKPNLNSSVIIPFVRGTVEKGRKLPWRTVLWRDLRFSYKTWLVGDLCLMSPNAVD